jgi:probable rRNA maturation factor
VQERLNLTAGFSLVLVSDQAIQRLNTQFAGRRYPTDVLSFPSDTGVEPYLGDIFVSVETADRQRQSTLDKEIQILALHGVLHLMGFNHECDDGEMRSFEDSLRQEFGLE